MKIGEGAARIAGMHHSSKADNKRLVAEEALQGQLPARQDIGGSEADFDAVTTLSGASSVEAEPLPTSRGTGKKDGPRKGGSKMDASASFPKTPSPLTVPNQGNSSPSTSQCTPPVMSKNVKMLKLGGKCPSTKAPHQMSTRTPRSVNAPRRVSRRGTFSPSKANSTT